MAVLTPGALHDPERLAALRRLGLDNGDTTAFDRLARLAAEYLQVPQAMVSIVEDERQVFAGLAVSGQSDPPYDARDAPIRYSYCQYVVDRGQPLIVSDARQDPMLCTHPALLELGAVSYIGVPITLPDGHVLGSFCAVDTEPRQWTDAQVAFLTDLTASVVTEIELRHELDQRAELEARHAAAEAHYRRLATGIPQGVYVLNAEGRFTEVNESAERILERSADELIGQTLGLVISERNERPVGQIFHEVISGKSDDVEFETWITRPSGEDRLLLVTASAIDGDGRITGLHGIARDITDERAAEAAVRESELRLRQILDALPIGAVLAEPPGRLVWHNPAADRIWGGLQPASPEAYEHYRGYESETGREIEPKEWPLARALLGEVVEGVLLDIDTFDGRRCTTLNSAVPLHSETGEITAAIAIMEDVTDARAHDAEQRLLAAALEGLSEGICLVTPEGVIIYANETFTTVLGIDPDRVPGVRFADFADSPEVEAEQQDHLRLAMENGRWSGRVRRPRLSDGVEIPIDLVLGRVEHDGDTRLLFGIAQDATVEIEREQHLRRAERLASVGTMIGGVAHELNNPLQAILNYAQLLLLDERSPEDRDALGTMEREAQRMAKIVADLKQIARSTQEVSDTSASADLNDVVRHVMTVQEYSLRTSNIEVRLDLGTDLPPILVDRGQLEQVLVNLVVNAEQAMSSMDGARLILRTRASARGASLHVVDNGHGIPAHQLERIFDPFFTTKAPGVGTGLGLSLVHSIVTEHGGEIRVDSEIGTGTAFRLDWLRAVAHEPAPETETAAVPADRPKSLRVLVVDDEAPVRSVMARYLTRRGHTVEQAADGGEALKLLDDAEYDVILSDLRMPGLGGEAMMERLRERGLSNSVIFMTGDAAGAAARLGAMGVPVLLKPVELAEVARAVETRKS